MSMATTVLCFVCSVIFLIFLKILHKDFFLFIRLFIQKMHIYIFLFAKLTTLYVIKCKKNNKWRNIVVLFAKMANPFGFKIDCGIVEASNVKPTNFTDAALATNHHIAIINATAEAVIGSWHHHVSHTSCSTFCSSNWLRNGTNRLAAGTNSSWTSDFWFLRLRLGNGNSSC